MLNESNIFSSYIRKRKIAIAIYATVMLWAFLTVVYALFMRDTLDAPTLELMNIKLIQTLVIFIIALIVGMIAFKNDYGLHIVNIKKDSHNV